MYIDTHVHLNDERLYSKLDEVLASAQSANVTKMIVVGYDVASSKFALKLANEYPNIYASIGFHPTEKNLKEADFEWLAHEATNPRVVAIGECGYDFHWKETTEEEQTHNFIKQIEIAKAVHKPLVIHSRDAIQITLDTLRKTKASVIGGVMHSYSGSVEMAKLYIKEGFYLGIGGPVTFLNAKEIKLVVQNVEDKFLLSETDAPYLTPHPFRGTENSPRYIPMIVGKMAELKGITETQMTQTIAENAKRLFNIEV